MLVVGCAPVTPFPESNLVMLRALCAGGNRPRLACLVWPQHATILTAGAELEVRTPVYTRRGAVEPRLEPFDAHPGGHAKWV